MRAWIESTRSRRRGALRALRRRTRLRATAASARSASPCAPGARSCRPTCCSAPTGSTRISRRRSARDARGVGADGRGRAARAAAAAALPALCRLVPAPFVPESDQTTSTGSSSPTAACGSRRGRGRGAGRSAVLALGVTPFPRVPPVLAASGIPASASCSSAAATRISRQTRRRHRRGQQRRRERAVRAPGRGGEVELLVRSARALVHRARAAHPRGPCASGSTTSLSGRRLRTAADQPLRHASGRVRAASARARTRLNARLMRPGAAPWLREHVEGVIPIGEGVEVQRVESRPTISS